MKDVLVDVNIAKDFCNPITAEYKRLIEWLFTEGSLVVTKHLIGRYAASCGASPSDTNVMVIIASQLNSGRLNAISAAQLRAYRVPERIQRRLRCNQEDRDFLKAVILSVRRFALSGDRHFRYDVNSFPGVGARAEERPEDLPYES